MPEVYYIEAEKLAYWYFRLNGCLMITDFVIHPDSGTSQCTDIDIIAVRFPHRAELLCNSMLDDKNIFSDITRIRVIIAEAKTGFCDLNKPWLKPSKKNMQRVLRAMGVLPVDMIENVSKSIYDTGVYIDSQFYVSLFCLGSSSNDEIKERYPEVYQLKWEDALLFIHTRFRNYKNQKTCHPLWDDIGKKLWDLAMKHPNYKDFRKAISI